MKNPIRENSFSPCGVKLGKTKLRVEAELGFAVLNKVD
jgi:hypothetical protein